MKSLKLIIFDWDGTIVDSVSKITECKQFLARKYSLPIPDADIIREVIGTPFKEALKKCFPTATPEILHTIAEEFHALMQTKPYQADIFPGAHDVLTQLKNHGLKLAIATSKARVELDHALSYLGVANLFDMTCCAEEYENKPDPAMLNHIIQSLNISKKECVMIGDTVTDIMFAKNANINVICVTFGVHEKEKLETLRPLAFIDDWKQLTNLVGESC